MEVFRKAFPGRTEMIEYCREQEIHVEASASKPYSMDRNLLHISYEAGILEDPWFDPTGPENKGMYKLTTAPEDAPDEAQYIELTFESGDCVAIDGETMTPAQVLRSLNTTAGRHGIGRVDIVENRFVGMKSRGVYETPGGTILLHAHRNMETLTMDRDLMQLRDSLIPRFFRTGLQRLLVCPGARGFTGIDRRLSKDRYRYRSPEALQGQHHYGRSEVAPLAVR